MSVTTTFVVPAVKNCGPTRKVIIPFVGAKAGTTLVRSSCLDIHCRNSKVIYFPIFSAAEGSRPTHCARPPG